MPRTFSRGTKFDVVSVERIIGYLSDADNLEFIRRQRLQLCPEAELIEQDLFEFFEFLFQRTSSLETLIDGLTGGGIIPNSMLTHIRDIERQAEVVRTKFLQISV